VLGKQKEVKTLSFILSNNETPWHVVGLSVMATQASALRFFLRSGLTMTEWVLCSSILDYHSDGCHLRYFIRYITSIKYIQLTVSRKKGLI
jgi:hypothetical protein